MTTTPPPELQDLARDIYRHGRGLRFAIPLDRWVRCNDLVRAWCEENDRPFIVYPEVVEAGYQHFIWGGFAVVVAGA